MSHGKTEVNALKLPLCHPTQILALIGADVDLPAGIDARVAGVVQYAYYIRTEIRACVHGRRRGRNVQVRRGR